jgi:hypothetical protein
MPQFSIPDGHSREPFVSPRKSLLVIGIVCALSAAALLTGRMPAPTPALDAEEVSMDAIHLTHMQLAKVEPGSLVLVAPTDADAEQYFAIAVHRAGEPLAPRLVSFRGDRGALRAIRTDLSTSESPERFVLSLGRHFSVEPNLLEPIRTDLREQSALTAGDLLVHEGQQLLVVEAGHDGPPLVADMAAGEVSELSAPSVAVVTHWNICVRNAEGQRTCVVDTKSHKSTTASASASFPLQRAG